MQDVLYMILKIIVHANRRGDNEQRDSEPYLPEIRVVGDIFIEELSDSNDRPECDVVEHAGTPQQTVRYGSSDRSAHERHALDIYIGIDLTQWDAVKVLAMQRNISANALVQRLIAAELKRSGIEPDRAALARRAMNSLRPDALKN